MRDVLKTVAEGYEIGKKHFLANKEKVESSERACMIKENGEEVEVAEDTSEDDYQSCEEDESIIESSSDQTEVSHLSTNNDSDTTDKEDKEETDYSNGDTDESVHERCLLISSAANIRRREMQAEGYFYKEGGKEVIRERKRN